jgi:hypothetical protein
MTSPQRNARRLKVSRHNAACRRTVIALLFVHGATACGVPLPVGRGLATRGGEWFPCSADACGCDSAARCWSSCCCHSLSERLHWARRHRIRPPEFALAQARQQGLDVTWADETSTRGVSDLTCHATGINPAYQSCSRKSATGHQGAVDGKECCKRENPHLRTPCASHQSAQQDVTKIDYVIAWRALTCQGKSVNWLAAVPLFFALPTDPVGPVRLAERVSPFPSLTLCAWTLPPPVPPPEWV